MVETITVRLRQLASHLSQLEIWLVASAVVISMVWPSLLPAAVITAAFFWVIRWIAYGRPSIRTPADWAIIVLLIMAGITVLMTPLPEKTLIQSYRLLTGIALYYALANWCRSSGKLRLVVNGVFFAGLGLAFFSFISVEWAIGKLPFIPINLYQRFVLLVSDTVNPNVMAGSLVLLFPIVLGIIVFGWTELGALERYISGLSAFAMFVILVLSQSRSAWITLGLVMVAFLILRLRWGWIVVLLGLGGITATVYLIGASQVVREMAVQNTLGGTSGRLETWARAIYMIQDHPFTGVGMGSFLEVLDTFYPYYPLDPGKVPHAHNIFLQVAVDLGVTGVIAWLAIMFCIYWVSWQLFYFGRQAGEKLIVGVGAGMLCSLLALVTHGALDSVTWGMVRSAPIVWAVWGIAVAFWNFILGRSHENLLDNADKL